MRYEVVVTRRAVAALDEQVTYLARDCHAPLAAERFFQAVGRGVRSLEVFPHRCPRAPECERLAYTVRMLIVKRSYLVLYTVDDAARRVTVVGFRHAARLPLDLGDPP